MPWRKEMRQRRAALPSAVVESASALIAEHLLHHPWYQNADQLSCYIAQSFEVQTAPIIQAAWRADKKVYIPYADDISTYAWTLYSPQTKLVAGPWEIPQPSTPTKLEPFSSNALHLIPALAVDADGHRLGHGLGIYDRLLHNQKGHRVALIFSTQHVAQLPHEPHDIYMHGIVTQAGIIENEGSHA